MTTYSTQCLGDGHTACDWHHEGHGFNAAAEALDAAVRA